MRELEFTAERPGPEWRVHGWTTKLIWTVDDGCLIRLRLRKRRWFHAASGSSRHDRPFWDVPGSPYGLDVVITLLCCWLLTVGGLHATAWPWSQARPARRTVQRWAATLAPVAGGWLQTARERIIDYVAPRPLDEYLPTGGIPPPEGRTRCSEPVLADKLVDVIWIHENVARALPISLRRLLGVVRWRWPEKHPQQRALWAT